MARRPADHQRSRRKSLCSVGSWHPRNSPTPADPWPRYPRSRLSRLFQFLICIWSYETARNSWNKECIERSNNSASIASICNWRVHVGMGCFRSMQHTHLLTEASYIFFFLYIIIPLFHQRIPAKWVCTKKNGYPKHEFQFGTYGKVMINIEISKFFMVFPSCFLMFFAWW